MRLAVIPQYSAPNHAGACAAYEGVKDLRTRQFNNEVELQMGIEKMILATDPAAWINDHTADPSMDLAILYKQIALYYNEPEKIGQIVKNLLDNRMRAVAEFSVSQ
jgi:hypothetical protein